MLYQTFVKFVWLDFDIYLIIFMLYTQSNILCGENNAFVIFYGSNELFCVNKNVKYSRKYVSLVHITSKL